MKIVVLDGYTLNPGDNPWEPVEAFGHLTVNDRTDPARVAETASGAEILLTNKTPVTAETVNALKSLKFISVLATGYNIVDVEAAGKLGIPVSNIPEYGTDSVAQFTMALILELSHHVGEHDRSVHNGDWSSCPDWCYRRTPQVLLSGKTMGIVGFGRIGRRVGELAHAFGMNVLAFDTAPANNPDYQPFEWCDVDEIFKKSDIVTLHCPQTAENTGFVCKSLLKSMKRTGFLINASRGGLVCEKDLAEALNTGILAGAALDVVSAEPIDPDNPLLSAKNCLLTPHMAWSTLEARRRLMQGTAENIRSFIAGRPINVVNRAFLV
jgi:glycerate dehydrogenase